jgi:hypothetical protein
MNPNPRRTDPLSAWFLLLTTAAVICTFLGSAVVSRLDTAAAAIGLGSNAVVFGILGFCIRPRLRNAVLGFIGAALMISVAGILVGVQTTDLTVQAFAVLAGSVMIVIVGLVGRSVR